MVNNKDVKSTKSKEVVGRVIGTIMLNVRSNVSLTSDVVSILNKGDEVVVDMGFRDPAWSKLKSPVKGYVLSKYIATRK